MLVRENELRLSKEVQAAYAKYPEDFAWKERITVRTQRFVCTEFGFTHDIEEGLDLLRSATALFPEDQEVKNSAHWLKYNICYPCPFVSGQTVPDIMLYALDKSPWSLHNFVARSTMPTVVLAGSYT
jgi:hypothetical protein